MPSKPQGKLRLTPEQLLAVIHAAQLADWSLQAAARLRPPRLSKGPGGRPAQYRDRSILLMALVQTLWRKSYEQIGLVWTKIKTSTILFSTGLTTYQLEYA